MAIIVRMPAVFASATEAAIQAWSVSEGQTIDVGEPFADIETEKAVVEYAAEVAGTVGKLIAQPGENLNVGEPIAIILDAGENEDQLWQALDAAGIVDVPVTPVTESTYAASDVQPATVAQSDDIRRIFASPIVRRLVRERGLDLGSLEGTGPGGRIVRRDLDNLPTAEPVAAAATAPVPAPVPVPAVTLHPGVPTLGAGFTDIPLTGMRRAIARRLTESKTTVPHFYLTAHVRVDRLFALRADVNQASGRKASVNDFVIKAVAGALSEVPAANAIWGGDHIRHFDGVDLAVAVAVEGGLLTPVLRGVDTANIATISKSVADLAERARAGKLRQEDLEGGSFSVSNLGMYGVDEFSAILNPPHAGILAVSAAKQQAVVDDGQLAVGTVMTVTLSADHRVIDGAVGAEWMASFVRLIEHPISLLL